MAVSAVYRQLDAREEATEIDSHDREMPWMAFPEPSGMSSWRVVEGDCVVSELGFKNGQIFIQIGIIWRQCHCYITIQYEQGIIHRWMKSLFIIATYGYGYIMPSSDQTHILTSFSSALLAFKIGQAYTG
ncbi:hypothetical protein GCM10011502_09020 [Oceanisphaera marina]|uniref:Uncharacterized protein n=1 Tax=Oceanisphaera marina TaxID=2017550 RepID=A0ABQ1IIG5_9GAMM|nr:hypothetical protein GCM10011502_09020 [Oceanisphaera marina]